MSSRLVRRANGLLALFWLVMTVPTALWWADSVRYIAWLSVYALIASHGAAWVAARAEERQEEHLERLLAEINERDTSHGA